MSLHNHNITVEFQFSAIGELTCKSSVENSTGNKITKTMSTLPNFVRPAYFNSEPVAVNYSLTLYDSESSLHYEL